MLDIVIAHKQDCVYPLYHWACMHTYNQPETVLVCHVGRDSEARLISLGGLISSSVENQCHLFILVQKKYETLRTLLYGFILNWCDKRSSVQRFSPPPPPPPPPPQLLCNHAGVHPYQRQQHLKFKTHLIVTLLEYLQRRLRQFRTGVALSILCG